MSRSQRFGAVVGLLLLVAYAVPLLFPPPAIWALPAANAGLWERVFPGVPVWWILARLICLLLGAGLLALSIRAPLPLALGPVTAAAPAARTVSSSSALAAQWVALGLALAHAMSGLFAARFGRFAETSYVAFLAVPAGILALTEARAAGRVVRSVMPRLLMLLIVPLFWLGMSFPTEWRSPKAANVVDMWIMVERLENVASGAQKMLTDSAFSPGRTNAYMVLEGVPFIGPDRVPLTFAGLQAVHAFWMVVCAIGIGVLVWLMVGQPAAIVAQAVFLFSQYAFSVLCGPGPLYFPLLCAVLLLLCVLAVRDAGSTAALAAFGAVAGLSATDPVLGMLVLLLSALMFSAVRRHAPVPWRAVGVAGLSAAAAVLPNVPGPGTLAAMARLYAFGHVQFAGITMILFGQRSLFATIDTLSAGSPAPFDVPLGALLAPFAIAHAPHRLWGDTLLDPVGAALMATGLALSVVQLRRNRAALFLLALLVAQLGQGFTSKADAVSHVRFAPALVPLVVFAGVGFEALRRAFASTMRPQAVGAAAAALIAAAGFVTFERVNPTILPASWLATSLEALGHSPNADAVFLDYGALSPWLYVERIAALVPTRPLPVRTFEQFEGATPTSGDPLREVYFWSPALEDDGAVSRIMCDRWPGAALYMLLDKAALFHTFAGAPGGASWRPRLPHDRWSVSFCEAPVCRPPGATWSAAAGSEAPFCSAATVGGRAHR